MERSGEGRYVVEEGVGGSGRWGVVRCVVWCVVEEGVGGSGRWGVVCCVVWCVVEEGVGGSGRWGCEAGRGEGVAEVEVWVGAGGEVVRPGEVRVWWKWRCG